ncbi:M56 family metallopeptidase [Saccharibacillus sp. CPCC 101409]|uniref:M56 family metallopeptidase n=1 Tax=Saccharibacillus sp. CPCC 101409 TaxID=3058041 RepID=UPI0026728482|nr:M56 family metallopeptidase [Saccharibacillus sp. CPCC 101409]MDO3408617.1 M56 family metallopeptidase [Saccharibacillus sp. CPCC 101409]
MNMLLQMSLSAAVLIALIALLRFALLHRLPKKTFLFLWAVVLLRLLVPFEIPSPVSFYTGVDIVKSALAESAANRSGSAAADASPDNAAGSDQAAGGGRTGSAEGSTAAKPPFDAPPNAEPAPPLAPSANDAAQRLPIAARLAEAAGFAAYLPALRLAGTIGLAAYFAAVYIRQRRKFADRLPLEGEASKLAARWLREHPLRRSVQIRRSDRIAGPLTYGIFRPVVLLPSAIAWTDEAQLRHVLAHEWAHIRRFDALLKPLMVAAACLHWFNPFVWLMVRLANRDLECACDESAIRPLGPERRAEYAMTLIGLEERRNEPFLSSSHFGTHPIEERIAAIMKTKKTSPFGVLCALLLVACTTAVFATSTNADAERAAAGGSVSDPANNAAAELPNSADIPADAALSISSEQKNELARTWAEGWKTRDGSLRIAIMSSDLLQEFRSSQLRENGDADSTAIRWSSPWVDDYAILPDGQNRVIKYIYKDSAEKIYISTERLTFGPENGQVVITGCESLEELQMLKYPEPLNGEDIVEPDPDLPQYGVQMSDIPAGEILLPATITVPSDSTSRSQQSENRHSSLEQRYLYADDMWGNGNVIHGIYYSSTEIEYVVMQNQLKQDEDVPSIIQQFKQSYSEPVHDTVIGGQPAVYVDGEFRKAVHFPVGHNSVLVASWDSDIENLLNIANQIAAQQ